MKKSFILIFIISIALSIFAGCEGGGSGSEGGSSDTEYLTFDVDVDPIKTFSVYQSFEEDTGDYGYIALFQENLEDNTSDTLQISLPESISVGDKFDNLNNNLDQIFIVHLFDLVVDPLSYSDYRDDDVDFSLEITRWDGPGGYAEGEFSGFLRNQVSPFDNEYVEGNFRAKIID